MTLINNPYSADLTTTGSPVLSRSGSKSDSLIKTRTKLNRNSSNIRIIYRCVKQCFPEINWTIHSYNPDKYSLPNSLKAFQKHSESLLEVFRKPLRIILEAFEKYSGSLPEIFWRPFRSVLKTFQKSSEEAFRSVLKAFQKFSGSFLNVFWKLFSSILKTFQKYCESLSEVL